MDYTDHIEDYGLRNESPKGFTIPRLFLRFYQKAIEKRNLRMVNGHSTKQSDWFQK